MQDLDLTTIPLGEAPPGEEYNLVDGPSQAWMPRLSIYITVPIMVVLVILRLFTRFTSSAHLDWDDCDSM
jgi:hypothetical protein